MSRGLVSLTGVFALSAAAALLVTTLSGGSSGLHLNLGVRSRAQVWGHDSRTSAWTTVDGLNDVAFDWAPAPGCPPPPRRCGLNDAFDEVLVLSLPRRAAYASRITSQLDRADVKYRLVQAHDKRTWEAAKPLQKKILTERKQRRAGVLALYLTHLAVWGYIKRSPFQRFLILEDDVILHRDFPATFDAGIRRIPNEWRSLFLGVDAKANDPTGVNASKLQPPPLLEDGRGYWVHGGWDEQRFQRDGFFRPVGVRGSWAMALHRDFVSVIDGVMKQGGKVIDNSPLSAGFSRWPNQSFVMFPAVAMTDSAESELGNYDESGRRFARNGWNPADFDTVRGYTGSLATAPPQELPQAAIVSTRNNISQRLTWLRSQWSGGRRKRGFRVVACVFNRDNHAALREWAIFHVAQGLDHFDVYDDGSQPPLASSGSAAGMESFFTFISAPWYSNASQRWTHHAHDFRQIAAYRDCARRYAGRDVFVAMIDVDEFVWSCDRRKHLTRTLLEAQALRNTLACPRFGPIDTYNVSVSRVAQFLRRAPNDQLGEDEAAVGGRIRDCKRLQVPGESSPCYGSREKSIYNMRLMTPALAARVGVHSITERVGENKWVRTSVSTSNVMGADRQSGLCCNHYFATTVDEMRVKAMKNTNPFYLQIADSKGVLDFYQAVDDHQAADLFGQRMNDLLRIAQPGPQP